MLELERDGAELLPGLCTPAALDELEELLDFHEARAGIRIFDDPALAGWLAKSPISDVTSSILGSAARAVRAILFDKTQASNWALAWHQDRTIPVRRRLEVPGFDHWTVKSDVDHVEPPFGIVENMLTARIHIDPVSTANSPSLVAPGSHRLGRIEESDIDGAIRRCGTAACLADRGDVWLYRTAILHASEPTRSGAARRILQVDFSSDDLPGGLDWVGIA